MIVMYDVRYAFRWLARHPRFTTAAVLLLAIGIGCITAAFSVANWLVIRPVPGISDDGRLATVWFEEQASGGSRHRVPLSYPNYAEVMRTVAAIEGMAGFHGLHLSIATPSGVAQPVVGEFATANYTQVLRIDLQVGRWFSTEEDMPPVGSPVVVISDRIWSSVFNRDPNVVGDVLEVRDRRFTVIGVAPPGFHGPDRFGETDLWLPARTQTFVTHSPRPATVQERNWGGFFSFVARLAPRATLSQARDQLRAGLRSLTVAVPEVPGYFADVHPHVLAGVGADTSGRLAQEAILILGITIVVLIIACANVANLLLIRGLTLTGDLAVRQAFGAGRMKLAYEQMAVAVPLAIGGCVIGLPLGLALVRIFNGLQLGRATLLNVPFDWRVFSFALGTAVVVGALAGLAPALAIPHLDLAATLKGASRTHTGRHGHLRRSLAAAQIAASVVLVVCALLLLTTLRNLTRVDLGFNPDGVVVLYANPAHQGYSTQRQAAYWADLVRRMQAVPGVREVATASLAPFLGLRRSTLVSIPGAFDASAIGVLVNEISPNYFSVLGIPIVKGRGMTPNDSGQDLAILNATLGRRLFGPADPVGSAVSLYVGGGKWQQYRVIGVARDSRWISLTDQIESFIYTPKISTSLNTVALVRSHLPEASIIAASRSVAGALDPRVPLEMNAPLVNGIESYLSERRMLAKVLGLLAVIGCTLAGFGLYAAIAFTTVQRTQEFGVRLALGAHRRDILSLVLRDGVRLAGLGLAFGLGAAAFGTRLLQSRLFGIRSLDPATFALAVLILGVVVLLACLAPARAATRIEPISAAKHE